MNDKDKNTDQKMWTTKNGEKINIKDITDSHLRNISRMLYKSNKYHAGIKEEMIDRGFGAETHSNLSCVIQSDELWYPKNDYEQQHENWLYKKD